MRQFLREAKEFGIRVALYNVKFNLAYKSLGAKSMRVTKK